EDFLKEVDDNTFLVSMMLVNNENGYCLPVQEVFRSIKRKDSSIITHCDAVQGFLKIPFKTKTLFADLISISGHKIHAAKGVGA
ncbi:MAG: aminotransferase class V-fold PLP-dependent enzyme, partial [Ruminococcus sp.]|nr:aminotransferase class V-fold PLP-dependent enzyme [Ruminococcus sp.]